MFRNGDAEIGTGGMVRRKNKEQGQKTRTYTIKNADKWEKMVRKPESEVRMNLYERQSAGTVRAYVNAQYESYTL
jgi:hypothetical protein